MAMKGRNWLHQPGTTDDMRDRDYVSPSKALDPSIARSHFFRTRSPDPGPPKAGPEPGLMVDQALEIDEGNLWKVSAKRAV